MPMKFSLLLLLLAVCLLAASANINVGRYDSVHIVPAPGKVVIDGDLRDWDTSGEFFTFRFEEQKDKYFLKGYMMYDAENLYIAAHVRRRLPDDEYVQSGRRGVSGLAWRLPAGARLHRPQAGVAGAGNLLTQRPNSPSEHVVLHAESRAVPDDPMA